MDGEGVAGEGEEEEKDRRSYLDKFRLYETRSKFYVFGKHKNRNCWRILKIDRSNPGELNLWEDSRTYSKAECKAMLNMLQAGNRPSGGLKHVTCFYGIIGFVKFLGPYYMILITERKEIGSICGQEVYAITKTKMIAVSNPAETIKSDLMKHENRYKKILCSVDLTKDFFYSYSYNIMNSLQKNLCATKRTNDAAAFDSMFVWNAFLTLIIRNILQNAHWIVALVHGFFKQDKLFIHGKEFMLTLIARRSRYYAGTRYLKRGVNEKGRVANDVETEQIVSQDGSGACHLRLTSVVQTRGSIPLYWSQETSLLNVRPNITLQKKDKNYEATKLHFNNLAGRYGNPIIIFNLIKKHEKKPRESILHNEFAQAINFINRDLSIENRLKFVHWDLHNARKASNVLLLLAEVSAYALTLTDFFHCEITPAQGPGDSLVLHALESQNSCDAGSVNDRFCKENELDSCHFAKLHKFQRGVLRTNCIDCLDRTNVAQFAYGLAAFGYQLHALDLIDTSKMDLDAPLAKNLMKFYETMGDTLALQYGGSAAHHQIISERGRWNAATRSKEFLRSIQRHCSNVYLDGQKQDAINVFLGYFRPESGKPALWDLGSDQHNIGRLLSFSDEISRTSVRKSLSVGSLLSESSNISTNDLDLDTEDILIQNQANSVQQDDEAQDFLLPDIMNGNTRSTPERQFSAESDNISFDETEGTSNDSSFIDLDNISSLNSHDAKISKRFFNGQSSMENHTTGISIHGEGSRRVVPAYHQNGSSNIGNKSNMESHGKNTPAEEFQRWIDHGSLLFW